MTQATKHGRNMSIWFETPNLALCQQLDLGLHEQGTVMQTLGIEICDIGDNYLSAKMVIKPYHHNPLGAVHGGVNVVLAETVASYAANFVVDFNQYYCVGQEISASHLKASHTGFLLARATPQHLGKRSSVWDITIHHDDNCLVSVARMTAAVLQRRTPI